MALSEYLVCGMEVTTKLVDMVAEAVVAPVSNQTSLQIFWLVTIMVKC